MQQSIGVSSAALMVALPLNPPPAFAQDGQTGGSGTSAGYRAGTVQEVGIPVTGVELGMGWDSRRGEVVPNRCIEFAPIQTRGQATRLHLTEVSDKSELMQTLNVNASVSVRTIFASGSAQASFAKSSKVKASSTNLVLQATIDNGVLFAGPKRMPDRARYASPQFGERGEPAPDADWRQWSADAGTSDLHSLTFRSWAKELLDADDAADFRQHCGDSFVGSIQSGAELLGLLTFSASSASEAQKISASIKGDFGIVQASASATETNNSARESSNLEVTVSQIGGSGGPMATSRADLVEKLKLLATEAAKAPKFHSMQVVSYDSLADWPSGLAIAASTGSLEAIADTYWFLGSYYDLLEEIIAEPAAYSYATGLIPSELMELQDRVLEKRAGLLVGLRAAAAGKVPDNLKLAAAGLPVPGGGSVGFPVAVMAAPGAESGLSAAMVWVESLGEALEEDLPLGNPNTLLLHLPLPVAATSGSLGDAAALRALAVRRHLREQAKRFCRLDPTDNQCLTNAELVELEEVVNVNLNNPPENQRLQNIGSGLCLALPLRGDAFVVAECDATASDRAVFDMVDAHLRLTALGTCGLVQGDRLGFVAPCENGTAWSFDPRGAIRSKDSCLTARSSGEPIGIDACGPPDAPLPLTQMWRPLETTE